MTQDTDKIKDKIRKLLNLAGDSGAFPGEIDNALRFARRLMVEHNIPEDSFKKQHDIGAEAQSTSYAKADAYSFGRDVTKWETTLMHAICLLIGTINHYNGRTKVFKRNAEGKIELGPRGENRTVTHLVFYGPAADARDAVDLFAEWVHIIVTMARLKYGSYVRGGARSYCEGFAYGLYTNMQKIRAEEKEEFKKSDGRALVVFNALNMMEAKRNQAQVWLRTEAGIKLKVGRSHKNRGDDHNAFKNGAEDGKKTSFTRDVNKKLE